MAQDVGIKAIEIYFPSHYVAQSELETFLGASPGKYTIGLGQTKMSFCDDREDIYSLALTTVSSLLRKYSIDPNTIGRLEVGTESMLDKAKSCKSVLMQLFGENSDIEGVDTYNACYGGTNALFNAINWVESSAWDGRDAIVVAGDIALYDKPAARPTGGAGCVAMLIGPNAPLVFEPTRGSFMQHTYDFYKGDFKSEYPIVDGHFSNKCYLRALDNCYKRYQARKSSQLVNGTVGNTPLDSFDHFLFHAPNCKLVAKSYARLLYNDYLADPQNPAFKDIPTEVKEIDYESSVGDKSFEKTFMALTQNRFSERVQPSLMAATMCGNSYTASVYFGLVSLLSNVQGKELLDKRVGFFSYGSGLASSMYSLRVKGNTDEMARKLNLVQRLEARKAESPESYDKMCRLREMAYQQRNYTPQGCIESLASGTYYLVNVDEAFRRTYAIVP
ncbi:hydroxymethylglutaryl-CoA synthase [Trichophyton tonsurans CBS 112818]|uniref:Hydroxymethylglutaryl-CoA synthase n=2 Tax=Trichophyton TaxID=5550 RepID=F2PGD5_TRIEC|nr:hydroxymethylglutaryl-CoA synthase [Trichophyton tonsurans CBS 112818]EGE00953.1 hydroxymethylglutaryl-CoA synthase [Trichophyton equinum CBS 127.97]